MRVPLSWLQAFFEAPLPEVERLVDLLDGLGLAVEDGWWVTVLVFVVSAAVGTLIDRRREAA